MLRMLPKRKLAVLLLPALLIPAARAQVFADAFSAARLDRTRWDFTTPNGAAITTGAGLSMSFGSSGFSQVNLYTAFHLTGDFDVQVDFTLGNGWNSPFPSTDTGPQLNGGGIVVYLDQPNWMAITRGRFSGSQSFNFYSNVSLNGAPASQAMPTTASNGSLRVVALNGTYQFLFNTGSGWTLLATAPSWNRPVYIGLSGGTVNAHIGFATTLSSFRVNSGITDYEPYQLPAAPLSRAGFRIGGQFINEVIRRWMQGFQSYQPMAALKAQGMGMARACTTTVSDPTLAAAPAIQWQTLPWQDTFWSSREMVAQLFKDAAQAGMRINACFYLSDGPANASLQNAPAGWSGLSLADTAAQVEQYTFATTSWLLGQGISIDLYDVGNETLIGLLGFIPGQRIPSPSNLNPYDSASYLTASVWPSEATLFTAAIRGIRRADPGARIALHVEVPDGPSRDTASTFFRQMNQLGVPYDVAAISLPYPDGTDLSPYTAAEYFQRWNAFVDRVAALGKPVAIAESSYPWRNAAGFNSPMPDYPYTPDGQKAYFVDQLRWASNNENILSWDWFYPEWYPGINGGGEPPNLTVSGLFSDAQTLQPAASAMNFNIPNTSAPSVTSVVGSASFAPGPLAPGELVSLFGSDLAGATGQAAVLPLPAVLSGVRVAVGGITAPLLYAGPTQINFQVPFEISPGTAAVAVSTAFTKATTYLATIAQAAPQIFTWSSNRGIVQNPDYSLNTPDHPAHAGDIVVVYGTGEGQVSPQAPTGDGAPSTALAKPVLNVTATVGSQTASISFAGLTPGAVGLFQINLTVPQLAPGDYPIQISVGGVKSNSPLIAIQ
jgi:uncharacterized protein (TIGR03437 family)